MRSRNWILGGLIAATAAWVYAPVLRGNWLWDDSLEMTDNPAIRSAAGLRDIWLGRMDAGSDYFPLKGTVQWILWRLFGDHVLGYHLCNVALHVLSALLLWRILSKLGVGFGWVGAALFAVHPVAVESVAWMAELKNVLSLPLGLLAFSAYLDFDRNGRRSGLWRALAWFTGALLCKTSLVMLPCVTLLYAWWRRGRIQRRDLLAAGPFVAVSAVLGTTTIWFQQHRAVVDHRGLPFHGFLGHAAAAARAAAFYLGKCICPAGLSPVYPQWPMTPGVVRLCLAAAGLAILAVTVIAIRVRRSNAPGLRGAAFGLGWFFANLVPVLGVVPMAYEKISPVADHLAYVSLACLCGWAAAGCGWAARRPWLVTAAAAVALACCALLSRGYARVFESQESLWTFTLRRNPGCWVAHNNLGLILLESGRYAQSERELADAVRLNPGYFSAQANLGYVLFLLGRQSEAVEHYRIALGMDPTDPKVHNAMGRALLDLRRYDEAALHCALALQLKPDLPEARENFANALCRLGRIDEAIAQYRQALRAHPDSPVILCNVGFALAAQGRFAEAADQYRLALRFRPDYPMARNDLGTALARLGRLREAADQFRAVIAAGSSAPPAGNMTASDEEPPYVVSIQSGSLLVDAHYNLGLALGGSGHTAEAIAEIRQSLALDPGYRPARTTLALLGQN